MTNLDEQTRLRILADYGVLDTGTDVVLDEIVSLAADVCETPIALISFVDDRRQWFKARVGLDVQQTPRARSFCEYAIAAEGAGVFSVKDAREDPRFATNPLVTSEPQIVFYAGAPLTAEEGAKLGTLCVIDHRPKDLTNAQKRTLETLSNLVVRHLQRNRVFAERSASEAWLQAVIASIGDAVVSTDSSRRITFLNAVAETMTGWSRAEALGAPVEQLLPFLNEHTRKAVENPVERTLREGKVTELENGTLLVRKDGRELPIADSSAPVRNINGDVTGAVLVFRDVSDLKRLETERHRLEAERSRLLELTEAARLDAESERTALSLLFEQAPVAITVLNGPSHVIALANPSVCKIWGRKREDVLGKPLFAALPETAGQGLEDLLEKVLSTGVPFVGHELPVKIARGDGGALVEVFFTFVYQPMRDAEGRIRRILVVANDVTDSVLARRELERIFDMSLDLLSSSEGGAFTKVNPAFERILGWLPAEICGGPSVGFVHPDDRARTDDVMADLAAGRRRTHAFENRLRHKDGGYRWISWSLNVELGTIYSVGRDVTEEKSIDQVREQVATERSARETAETANLAMDQFLATVSHELRTPLNAMLGWTRLLRDNIIPETQRPKAIATIERNAVAQSRLIGDLLDVSRIISGKMRLDLAPVELVNVIEAALEVVRLAADAKGIRLHAILDPGAGNVTGDSARLQQVIWNVLSNAIKFTPKGGRVQVRLVRVASSVEISITDTGEGIDPDFLPHVFDRFRQADGTSARVHGGLGLGLAIVRTIVELHGGTAFAESEGIGKGATLVVRLPIAPVRSASADPVPEHRVQVQEFASLECPPAIHGLAILIVDDEEDARDLMVAILGKCGAKVTAAASAAEALDAFDRAEFDIIVSDIGMPGQDGYALAREMRARPHARARRVPIVALTAYARVEDRTRALRAGFNAHVAKPIEPTELLAVLASLVERASVP